jgi:Tol biopolymer transport system component
MTLSAGSHLGVYEIVARLGAGGMGEVYRARDARLNREVALKILPAAFLDDADRMARFAREAQVLASLNHPHIAAIYGLEEQALVIELVEGATLEERLRGGPVPLEESLAIARQIAEALEYAHEKGVVHRDLKPANVKMTPEGTVKVLDFGLAKVSGETTVSGDAANSPTLTMRATEAGLIMGTAGYMAPEQAVGKPVDKRADIWAFGVVLYELLTGKRLFDGETVSHTLASVLKDQIDVDLPQAPPPIRDLLARCLDRNPKQRLRDIGEARIAIERYLTDPQTAAPTPAKAPALPARLPWTVAAVFALAAILAGGALFWRSRQPPPHPPTARFLVAPPEGHDFNPNNLTVSPNGRHLVVTVRDKTGKTSLWLRDLDSTALQQLQGTTGALHPFWSPDSRSIAFFSSGRLLRLNLQGGPVQILCDVSGNLGGTWNAEGVILFAGSETTLMRVSSAGGIPSPVFPNEAPRRFRWPRFLPDGRRFLYAYTPRLSFSSGGGGTFVAALDGREPPRRILDTVDEVVYALNEDGRTGYLFFRRSEALMAAPFDAARVVLTGEPFPVLSAAPATTSGKAPVSASLPARWLVLSESAGEMESGESFILDRAGRVQATFSPRGAGAWEHIELSPDGLRLLGERAQGSSQERSLWTLDLARGVASRVVAEFRSGPAVWSHDGRRVFFVSNIGGTAGIYVANADGSGRPDLLLQTASHHLHASADGKLLAFESSETGGGREILVYSIEKRGKPEVAVSGSGNVGHPQFSPDGKWLAYVSSETGRPELFVQSYPAGNGRWQVTNTGVLQGRWRRDGKEICFATRSQQFMCASVTPRGGGLEFGVPVKLFDARLNGSISATYFDMSGDARRFYVNLAPVEIGGRPLTVVLNWAAGLRP